MSTVVIKDHTGAEVGTMDLEPKIFDIALKPEVIQEVVVAYQANRRQAIAHVKDRSEVRGGGRKPWRQKGTGRARHGSIRSPLWKGGGVTFGPTSARNFSMKMTAKKRRLALLMSLSDRARNENVIVVKALPLEKPKTKTVSELLKKIGAGANALVITSKKDENFQRSIHNMPRAAVLPADSLNALTVLRYKKLVIFEPALAVMTKHYIAK
ncbi:MAG: 50S ribosomal protein L4 [bacterium]|nr:50S ribosomal protein L4 [bacterium]